MPEQIADVLAELYGWRRLGFGPSERATSERATIRRRAGSSV